MENNTAEREEKTELIYWLLERYDTIRGAIANRAAIVLSADAIVLAATVLLLDKALSNVNIFSSIERIVLVVAIGLTLVLLAVSIYFATTATANVWKTSREILGPDRPQREFFYPRETLERANDFESFRNSFDAASDEELTSYALGELWSVTHSAFSRYQKLRRAIRFVVFSLVPFFLALLLFLFKLV